MRFKLKNGLLISVLQLVCGVAFSQTPDSVTNIEAKNSSVEKATFPGGKDELAGYLSKNVRYPKEAKKKKIEGRCYITFTVTGFGNISNVKVMSGVLNCPECDAEAIRVVKAMPQWIPASSNGKSFDSVEALSIIFRP